MRYRFWGLLDSCLAAPAILDKRFPIDLPNTPFDIARYVKIDEKHPDLTHRFFIQQMQINGGRNDHFAQLSSAGGLTMGHYDLSGTALRDYAKAFTLADNFFQAAFGGSFLNHQWLICACTPVFKDAPHELRQWKIDPATGKPTSDPDVTEDGYAVSTIQPHFPPFDSDPKKNRLPVQSQAAIGDRLSEKGISWAWYAGGWDDAVAGRKTKDKFEYHHQPFVYYANYAPGSQARIEHLRDRSKLFTDLKGDFPQLAFYKPTGNIDQHPGHSSILDADREVKEVFRGVAIFAKAFMGIPAQQAAKTTRPLMPAAAPAVLLHSLDTQQGVSNIILAMTRRDVGKPAFSLRKKTLRENTCAIASGDYSTPVSQRMNSYRFFKLSAFVILICVPFRLALSITRLSPIP